MVMLTFASMKEVVIGVVDFEEPDLTGGSVREKVYDYRVRRGSLCCYVVSRNYTHW